MPTQFDAQCHDNCAGIGPTDNRILVDNVTALSLTLIGEQITSKGRNVPLKLKLYLRLLTKEFLPQ